MDFSKLQAASKVTNEWKYPLLAANRAARDKVADVFSCILFRYRL